MKLRSTGVYHGPVSTAAGTPLLKDIRTSGKLIVGEFADAGGHPYLMLVNKSLKESVSPARDLEGRRRYLSSAPGIG